MLRNCKYIKSISIKNFSVKANIEFQGEKFRQHLSIQKSGGHVTATFVYGFCQLLNKYLSLRATALRAAMLY